MANFKYYPAVLKQEKGIYSVSFPDIPECRASGTSSNAACAGAHNAIKKTFFKFKTNHTDIPEPSAIEDVSVKEDETIILIPFDCDVFRTETKKQITILKWLEAEAKARNINLSETLEAALLEKLALI